MADIDITVGTCHRCRTAVDDGDFLCATCANDELTAFVGKISVPPEAATPDSAQPMRRLFGRRSPTEPILLEPPPAPHLGSAEIWAEGAVGVAELGSAEIWAEGAVGAAELGSAEIWAEGAVGADGLAVDADEIVLDASELHVLALDGEVIDEPALDLDTAPDEPVVDDDSMSTSLRSPAFPSPARGRGSVPTGLAAVIAEAFERVPEDGFAGPLEPVEGALGSTALTEAPTEPAVVVEPADAIAFDDSGDELTEPLVAAEMDTDAPIDDLVEPLANQGYDFNNFAIPASWLETKPAWYELASESEETTESPEATGPSRRLRHRMIVRLLLVLALATALMVLVGLWAGDEGTDRDVSITSGNVDIDEERTPSSVRPPADDPATRDETSAEPTASIPPTLPSTPPAGSGTASPAPAPTVAAPSVSTPAPAPVQPPVSSVAPSGSGSTSGNGNGHGNGNGNSGGGGNGGGGNGGGGKK